MLDISDSLISFDIELGYFKLGMVRNTLFFNEAWNFYVKGRLMKSHVQEAASPILFAIVLETVLMGFAVSSSKDLVVCDMAW